MQTQLPYDGAAGGSSDVNQTIADGDTEGHGDIQTGYPNHCFIPMVSALALSSDYLVNTSFDVSTIANYPYINNTTITPFDAIYAPAINEEHVFITNETVNWMMDEIGATELFLQNKIVDSPTDFEARNTILAGFNVTNSIAQGDFVVQNNTGAVIITAGDEIILKPGTILIPSGNGSINVFIEPYPCESIHSKEGASYSDNFNKKIEDLEENSLFLKSEIENIKSDIFMKGYPNPCSDHIHIEYSLNEKSNVEISLFNIKGEKLYTVENSINKKEGLYTANINTSVYSSGIYICELKINGVNSSAIKIQIEK
ncbi:MAG: hypothetical protein DRJ05_00440 [Bacteroidetes bacterium]|nr:MAG: hypothetical protein DRJ05_00440 [Bacteroidota bacterium]